MGKPTDDNISTGFRSLNTFVLVRIQFHECLLNHDNLGL